MNYLQIAQALRQECRGQGSGPSSVLGQTGRNADWVNWSARSWTDIQGMHDNWAWLTSRFTFPTVSGTEAYAYTAATDSVASATISRFRKWWPETMSAYTTSTGVSDEQDLYELSWARFDRLYRFGSQTNQRPRHVAVGLDEKLYLGPKPDAVYTVTGEYQKSAQVLSANTDTPEIHSDFHMLIVYYAMEHYAFALAAPDALANAKQFGGRLMTKLKRRYLPRLRVAGPMVR